MNGFIKYRVVLCFTYSNDDINFEANWNATAVPGKIKSTVLLLFLLKNQKVNRLENH